MKQLIILLLTIFGLQSVFTQQKISFDKNIKGQILNSNTGIVLVKTSDAVTAISPKDQKVAWKNEVLKKVDFSSYQEVPFTPYILFEKKPFISSKLLTNALGTKGVSRTLINVNYGKIFFDSEKQGFKAVSNTLLLPAQKAVLIDGIKDKKYVLALYDYETGNQRWETNLSDKEFFKDIIGSLKGKEKTTLDANGNIFWLKNRLLLKVSSKTGEIIHNQKGVYEYDMNAKKDIIYVFTNQLKAEKLNKENAVYALNSNTLRELWKAPPIVTGHVTKIVVKDHQLVVITSKGFNIINTKDGSKKWDKSDPLPLIKKIVPVKEGYLVVQENFLISVNNQGKKTWKKAVKITKSSDEYPIHIFDEAKEVLYITPSFANKVSIVSGTKIWSEDIVLNKAGFLSRNLKLNEQHYQIWYDDATHQFPVYNENNFYLFNHKDSKSPSSLQTFDFGREIPNLEVRKAGYFLSLNNQFYFFSQKGKLMYKKDFPLHKESSFLGGTFYWVGRGFDTATSVISFIPNQVDKTVKNVLVSTNLGFVTNASSSVYGTYQSYKKTLADLQDINSLGMDSNLLAVLERFKKGQLEDKNAIIVTPVKDTETSNIISLTKDTGKIKVLKKVGYEFDTYIVDRIEKIVYLFIGKEIFIEKF